MSWFPINDRSHMGAQPLSLAAPQWDSRGNSVVNRTSLVAIGALALLAVAIAPVMIPVILTVILLAVAASTMGSRQWGGGWFRSSPQQPWYHGMMSQWQQPSPWYQPAGGGRWPMQWNQGHNVQRPRVIPGFG